MPKPISECLYAAVSVGVLRGVAGRAPNPTPSSKLSFAIAEQEAGNENTKICRISGPGVFLIIVERLNTSIRNSGVAKGD